MEMDGTDALFNSTTLLLAAMIWPMSILIIIVGNSIQVVNLWEGNRRRRREVNESLEEETE